MKKLALLLAAAFPFNAAFAETLHFKDEGLHQLRENLPPGRYVIKGWMKYTGQGCASVAFGISDGASLDESFTECFVTDIAAGKSAILESEIYVGEGPIEKPVLAIDAYFASGGELKVEDLCIVSASNKDGADETHQNTPSDQGNGLKFDEAVFGCIFETKDINAEEDADVVKMQPVSLADAAWGIPGLQAVQAINGALSVEGMESLVLSLAPGEYEMGLISPQGGSVVLRAEGNVVIKGF